MRYTFAPGDLVVFHYADSQRTPLLGVTILYAVFMVLLFGWKMNFLFHKNLFVYHAVFVSTGNCMFQFHNQCSA